ncbi:MAG: SRPBCC family protein [Bacteroidaceae bacterium]
MEQHESSVKTLFYSVAQVYAKLSDLSCLEELKQRIPVDKLDEARKQGVQIDLNEIICDQDSITLPVPKIGNIQLAVCERELNKTVKFEIKGVPVTANLWIQVLPCDEQTSKLKITVRYDIPFFMKMMLKGKLDKLPEGIERLADILAQIKYA